jgi:hypothetical protein
MMHEKKSKAKQRIEKNRKENKKETPLHLLGIEPATPDTPATPTATPPHLPHPISHLPYLISNPNPNLTAHNT